MTNCVDGNDTDEVRRTRAWAASATQVLDSALWFRLGFAPSLGKAVAETRFGAIRDVRRLLRESFSCILHYSACMIACHWRQRDGGWGLSFFPLYSNYTVDTLSFPEAWNRHFSHPRSVSRSVRFNIRIGSETVWCTFRLWFTVQCH